MKRYQWRWSGRAVWWSRERCEVWCGASWLPAVPPDTARRALERRELVTVSARFAQGLHDRMAREGRVRKAVR